MNTTSNRKRRISAVAILGLAASVAATGTGLAATTPPSAVHATAVTAAAAPARSFQGTLPVPTGPHAAGEDVIHLTDASRPDPWVPSSGPRQLTVTMVYPAVPGTGTPAPYMTLAEAAGHIQHAKIPAGSGITPQNLSSVTTHAFDGARPQSGKYPLVVLSPGFGDPRMVLTSLATELASHGYVVALVGHTYEDSGETLANGQTPPCAICGDPATLDFDSITASRALDVSFVIDRLTHGNTAWPLAHLIDKHEIGVAGHSIGGAAAAATMITDPRVRAGVNMDGSFHPAPMPSRIDRPFLMLGAAAYHSAGGGDNWGQAWAALGGYKKWLAVTGANHPSFTDVDLLEEEAGFPTPPLDPERGIVITREYVTAFFDRALKGIHSPLLDGPSPNNPEVLFQY
ncbi:alpha/beta hydrolase [Kitasatospora sp. NBC_01300]|uniref:alpha/beta hydrolase family protein n=1 Tax=Kitasatospora sp. NBC_01300 TaxID=2903574 RepID=UPI002F90E809|nr:alpha/beta hydrolase [Kitasatospora sp. NBC_01300]